MTININIIFYCPWYSILKGEEINANYKTLCVLVGYVRLVEQLGRQSPEGVAEANWIEALDCYR